jgi:hypothetical protein
MERMRWKLLHPTIIKTRTRTHFAIRGKLNSFTPTALYLLSKLTSSFVDQTKDRVILVVDDTISMVRITC